MSSEPIIIRQLDKVANGIGYICIFWAWLDDFLGEMILKLCPFDPRKIINTDEEKLNQIFRSNGDIRDKIRVLRAVAFVRKWDDKWFKKVDKLLDQIDNDCGLDAIGWSTIAGSLPRESCSAALDTLNLSAHSHLPSNCQL
jgi:hypothetical protein